MPEGLIIISLVPKPHPHIHVLRTCIIIMYNLTVSTLYHGRLIRKALNGLHNNVLLGQMKGTKVQTLGACAVAGAWCMAGWLLGPGP